MKITLSSLGLVAGFAALLLSSAALMAQEIDYEKLEKKLNFDKTPAKDKPGAVASYADAIEAVAPSVVTIFSEKEVEAQGRSQMFEDPFFRRFFGIPDDMEKVPAPQRKERGLGSGVIISSDGYILTNNHVVGGADEIMVSLASDKKDYRAKVIGADRDTDVALIKIDAKGLKPITIGDSSYLRVGDVMLAIGNPFGLEQTVTHGIVSGMGRTDLNITQGGYENFIQTDASINRGNSGGALVDANGRLVGINTAIQSSFSGGNIGIGFAIPVNMALNIVERLLENHGEVKRGFLGVYMRELDSNMARALGRDDKTGVLITEVGAETPADKAGLLPGDLIIKHNGRPVESMARLRLDISNTKPGAEADLEIVRGEETKVVSVKLGDLSERSMAIAGAEPGESPHQAAPKKKDFIAGVQIRELDEETRLSLELEDDAKGVLIESVEPSSSAAEAGLRAGQIITQVDRTEVNSLPEAHAALDAFEGDVLLLQVSSGGRRDILAVDLKSDEEEKEEE